MNSIKACEYSRSRSFHDDLILQDQASGERSKDQWSSGFFLLPSYEVVTHIKKYRVLNLHTYLHTVKLLYDSWLW